AFLYILNARGKAGDAEYVWCAAFEEVGKLTRLRLAGRVAAGAALTPGADFGPRANIEGARPGRTKQGFVPRKRQEIDVRGSHVDAHNAGGLRRIDHKQNVSLARDAAYILDRLNRAQDVAGMRERDKPGLGGDGLEHIVRIDTAAAVGLQPRQRDLAGQLHRPQRPADAVVFQVRRDDVIALLQHALERHVQRVGAVEREDESVRPFAVEELIQEVPAIVEGAFGGEGHLVPRPAGIGQLAAGEAIQSLINRLRLREAGGGVVEVDHGVPLDSSRNSGSITGALTMSLKESAMFRALSLFV